jgi:hypothetical protein
MSAAPNRQWLVPKPSEVPAPDRPRPKPMARLFKILGKKPKPLATNLRRLGEK